MTLPTLTQETDAELHRKIKSLKDTEARTTAEIILHLFEIDTRGIYRDMGYSSLFSYCTEYLGYSDGSDHRKIEATKALVGQFKGRVKKNYTS